MNVVLNLLARFGWLAKFWAFFEGKKTYLTATAMVLSGAGQLVGAAASPQEFATLFDFLKNITKAPGYKEVLEGIGLFTLRHAIEKRGAPKPEESK